ncbi:hypothetical protein F4780DRAFT_795203 [Xylariomycetidae sp. FL0641]|nr:hypothetical protein F4780DRAFT_795203 [Xylariomycetidae sp. FL0641]
MSLSLNPSPYKPRPQPPKVEPSAPWTAARCQRLLRPLVSRLASLRRDTGTATTSTATSLSSTATSTTTTITTTDGDCDWLLQPSRKRVRTTYSSQRRGGGRQQQQQQQQPVGSDERPDPGPAPVPQPQPQHQKRTLKSLRTQQAPSPRGKLAIPATPLLKRARGQLLSSPLRAADDDDDADDNSSSNNNHNNPTTAAQAQPPPRTKKRQQPPAAAYRHLEERLARLRTRTPAARHADVEGVYRSLEALLRATTTTTTSSSAPPAAGPRSLMALALRRVPAYIAALAAQERAAAAAHGTRSARDGADASAAVYDWVEATLGAVPGTSRRVLRALARADGVRAVARAVAARVLAPAEALLLADLCVAAGAPDEAEALLAATVVLPPRAGGGEDDEEPSEEAEAEAEDLPYPPPASLDSALAPAGPLAAFAAATGRDGFLVRTFAALLAAGRLPAEWLATRALERVWSAAVRLLCGGKGGGAAAAVEFLGLAIPLLCRRRKRGRRRTTEAEHDFAEATRQTLAGVLATMAAMSLMGERELRSAHLPATARGRVAAIGDRIWYTLSACTAGAPKRIGSGYDLLYLTLFLASERRWSSELEPRVREGIEAALRQHETATAASHNHADSHYDNIASLVSSIARICSRGMAIPPHRCLDILFERLEALGFARTILSSLQAAAAFLLAQQTNNVRDIIYAESLKPSSHLGPGDEPISRDLFAGYRWEQTIGEWVTASPVLKKRGTRKRQLRSSTTGVDPNNTTDEHLPTGSTSLLDFEAESVPGPDLDTNQVDGGRTRRSKPYCSQETRSLATRKRDRVSQIETFTWNQSTPPSSMHSRAAVLESVSNNLHDELGHDKENHDSRVTKKPRRSLGKVALGTKPRASLSSLASISRNACSDDELC